MLIVFGGLPGTGKTTISRRLAAHCSAAYLRVDEIEHAIAPGQDAGTLGYAVAYALARSNLGIGQWVVADCVNPVAASRQAWHDIAVSCASPVLQVEVVCSDRLEHRRRVENRRPDIPGQALPTWQQVLEREYEPWTDAGLVVDTATHDPSAVLDIIERHLSTLS